MGTIIERILEQPLQRGGRFPMLPLIEGFGDILAQDDRRRFELTQCHIISPTEADDIRDAALETVQRVHDRHRQCAHTLIGSHLQDQFD